MLVHYVRFLYPGILVSESSDRKIKSRKEEIKLPKGAFAYQFFDREETEKGGETLMGKDKKHSGFYYKGREMTLAQVKKEMPDKDILISNMECNGYERIVMTKFGQAMPLNKEDVVIR